MENEWELLEQAAGLPQAELMRSFLEAQGIPVILNQEGAGHALGLTIGPLGWVEVMVPAHKLEAARQALASFGAGTSFNPVDEETPQEEEAPDESPANDPLA